MLLINSYITFVLFISIKESTCNIFILKIVFNHKISLLLRVNNNNPLSIYGTNNTFIIIKYPTNTPLSDWNGLNTYVVENEQFFLFQYLDDCFETL